MALSTFESLSGELRTHLELLKLIDLMYPYHLDSDVSFVDEGNWEIVVKLIDSNNQLQAIDWIGSRYGVFYPTFESIAAMIASLLKSVSYEVRVRANPR